MRSSKQRPSKTLKYYHELRISLTTSLQLNNTTRVLITESGCYFCVVNCIPGCINLAVDIGLVSVIFPECVFQKLSFKSFVNSLFRLWKYKSFKFYKNWSSGQIGKSCPSERCWYQGKDKRLCSTGRACYLLSFSITQPRKINVY